MNSSTERYYEGKPQGKTAEESKSCSFCHKAVPKDSLCPDFGLCDQCTEYTKKGNCTWCKTKEQAAEDWIAAASTKRDGTNRGETKPKGRNQSTSGCATATGKRYLVELCASTLATAPHVSPTDTKTSQIVMLETKELLWTLCKVRNTRTKERIEQARKRATHSKEMLRGVVRVHQPRQRDH